MILIKTYYELLCDFLNILLRVYNDFIIFRMSAHLILKGSNTCAILQRTMMNTLLMQMQAQERGYLMRLSKTVVGRISFTLPQHTA